MSKRIEIINMFYGAYNEDTRLIRSRHGQLEYVTTMNYIHRYAKAGDRILEIGAGTGRYSIALAKESYNVTAVELVEQNCDILKNNSTGIKNIHSFQGDALDLGRFSDNEFDITMSLGPLYHLYDAGDVHRAFDEAVRVTRLGGVIIVAFLSVHSILLNNYLKGNLELGLNENFTSDYKVRHFEKQMFTGYRIVEFEQLFEQKNIQHITTVATDSVLELAEERNDFIMSDEEFELFVKYHLSTCETRELLGSSSHLLYICRKIG